ncbi:hypothetical protein ACX6XY_10700 [Streptomyces sp. O3]
MCGLRHLQRSSGQGLQKLLRNPAQARPRPRLGRSPPGGQTTSPGPFGQTPVGRLGEARAQEAHAEEAEAFAERFGLGGLAGLAGLAGLFGTGGQEVRPEAAGSEAPLVHRLLAHHTPDTHHGKPAPR